MSGEGEAKHIQQPEERRDEENHGANSSEYVAALNALKEAYIDAHESDGSKEFWHSFREYLTIALVLVTVVLTGATYWVFRDQLQVSRDAITTADNDANAALRAANQDAFAALQQQRRASADALERADTANRQARDSFAIANRAWIAPIGATWQDMPKLGTPLAIIVKYANVGKLPAINAEEHYTFSAVPNSTMADGTAMKSVDSQDVCAGITPSNNTEVVYPTTVGEELHVQIKQVDPTTKKTTALYAAYFSGETTLIMRWCIVYRTLRIIHHSAFCYLYYPGFSEGLTFNYCDRGNYAD